MTPPELDPVTRLAVAELVQAAAHAYGLTGPIQYTVCRPVDHDALAEYLGDTEAFDD